MKSFFYVSAACAIALVAGCGTAVSGTSGTATGAGAAIGSGGAGTVAVTGNGGATSACEAIGALDRSCTTTEDCLAVLHTTSCCGSAAWIGIRSTQEAEFSKLEGACDASYPGCGCASGPPMTDDWSSVDFGTSAGVTCSNGVCATFSEACGGPCEAGRSCACGGPGGTPFCSIRCMGDGDCKDPAHPKCQFSFNGGICVDPNSACPE